MYHSWKALLVNNEQDLYSMDRILKLYRERNSISLFFVILFFIVGALALAAAIYMAYTEAYIRSFFMIPVSAIFFWSSVLFYNERKKDPVQNFVHKPKGFDFLEGRILSATCSFNEKRSTKKMIVKGIVKTKEGESISFHEAFDAKIWPFVDENSESSNTDMAKNFGTEEDLEAEEIKDKRIKLPIPVYVLYQKSTSNAAMIGIDKNYLDKAMAAEKH
jgi:hypothetical protein